MKTIFSKIGQYKKVYITIGILVSLLIIYQNDTYSESTFEKLNPRFEQLKTRVNHHIETHSSEANNLKDANFLSSYLTLVSNSSESEKVEKSDRGTLTTLKNKIYQAFSICSK